MSARLRGPVLVTGSSGQVGGQLVHLLGSDIDVLAPARAELDLASPDSITAYIAAHRPAWIVNAGAYTAVDKAETDVHAAEAINAVAPGVIGKAAAAIGAPVLHFSTDYVFAGDGDQPWRESDPPHPLNRYGATKLAGERALAASGAAHAIFRTSWVYGATGKNFLLTILRLAREKPELKVVADQHGAPTSADTLARLAIHTMFAANETGDPIAAMNDRFGGLYHACSAGYTTWFGFAEEFLRMASEREPGTPFAQLTPINSAEFPTPAKRPSNSRMDCARLSSRLGFTLPAWKDALARVMDEYYVCRLSE
jgi:dTDP-4-dehydrorhamnose reductase